MKSGILSFPVLSSTVKTTREVVPCATIFIKYVPGFNAFLSMVALSRVSFAFWLKIMAGCWPGSITLPSSLQAKALMMKSGDSFSITTGASGLTGFSTTAKRMFPSCIRAFCPPTVTSKGRTSGRFSSAAASPQAIHKHPQATITFLIRPSCPNIPVAIKPRSRTL